MAKSEYEKLMEGIRGSGQRWSESDLALARENVDAGRSIFTAKSDWASAGDDAGRKAANDAAEMIRQKYGGYSGGKSGSGFMLSDKYAPAVPKYDSPYKGDQDKLWNEILGREDFSYSPGADPSYQAYSEKYRNLGRSSAANALGSAAALTGGMPSSYAVTASQQAQDGYNAQLSDKIPELERAAYEMYLGDLQQKRNDLSTVMGMDEVEYGRQRDSYGDKVQNWQNNYQVGRDQVADGRYEDETAYGREQDKLQWSYQKDADAYERALAKWQLMGALDAEGAKVLGIPAGTQTTDYKYQLAQMAKKASGSSSGGGNGGTGGAEPDYEGLYAAAYASANPENFISSSYKKYGLTSASGLKDGFETWREGEADNGQRLYKQDFSNLVNYTKKCVEQAGRSPEYMYDALKKQGYDDAVIDQVFAALNL